MSLERYEFIKENKTWSDALDYCKRHEKNLVHVRNETENNIIKEVVNRDSVWMGLFRYVWVWWSDKTSSKFRNWEHGHPTNSSESCAASVINATHLGKWVESNCDEKLHFMCGNSE